MQVIRRIMFLGVILMFGLVNSAWSYVINDSSAGALNGADVGVLDLFIVEDAKLGNPTAEISWANDYIDPDINPASGWKKEGVEYFETNDSNVYAFQLMSMPEFYIVKNAKRIALFRNLGNLNWGVFDVSSLSAGMKLPDDEDPISHVTQFGGHVSVPEPGSIALLGFGLVGLFWARRK